LWADYEQRVVATDAAYQRLQKASEIVDVMYRQYCDAARVRDEAQMSWLRANDARNDAYDAYWATYDHKVA
jgi:hypothetical protein